MNFNNNNYNVWNQKNTDKPLQNELAKKLECP